MDRLRSWLTVRYLELIETRRRQFLLDLYAQSRQQEHGQGGSPAGVKADHFSFLVVRIDAAQSVSTMKF